MVRIQICGFETGDNSEFYNWGGTFSIQSTIKRTGGYALRVNPSAGTGYAELGQPSANGFPAEFTLTTAYNRFYAYFSTLPASAVPFAYAGPAGASAVCYLQVDASGIIKLVGSTTSPTIGTVTTGQWYRFEIKAVTSGTCEGSIDGGTVQTCTGQGLAQTRLALGSATATTFDIYYDDAAIDDAAHPGAGQVNILKPNATGTTSAWTNGAGTSPTNVAEVPHNSDTGYITSSTSGNVTTVNLDSSATGGVSGTIAAVQVVGIVRDGGGASSMSIRAKSSATNSDTTAVDPGASYTALSKILTTDPNTSAVWTTSGLDALEIGVVNSANVAVRCTALYAMVECVGAVAATGYTNLPLMGVG